MSLRNLWLFLCCNKVYITYIRTNERTNERTKIQRTKRKNERTNEWTNENWTNKRTNERTYEQTNERTNERASERVSYSNSTIFLGVVKPWKLCTSLQDVAERITKQWANYPKCEHAYKAMSSFYLTKFIFVQRQLTTPIRIKAIAMTLIVMDWKFRVGPVKQKGHVSHPC